MGEDEEYEEQDEEEQEDEYSSDVAESSNSFAIIVWIVSFLAIGGLSYLILGMDSVLWRVVISVVIGVVTASILASTIFVVAEWEKVIVLRLGKFLRMAESGVNIKIPILDEVFYRDTRDRSFDLVPQKILTKDTVPTKINAVIFYKIFDVKKSVVNARDWMEMTTERAKSELRETISKRSLDELLEKREELAEEIRKELDSATDPWGIKVSEVKIKDIILPTNMERAMAQESEAMREKRARIIKAKAEKEATKIMEEAGKDIAKNPAILELRRLQTIAEIGAENNTTTVVMIPEGIAKIFAK